MQYRSLGFPSSDATHPFTKPRSNILSIAHLILNITDNLVDTNSNYLVIENIIIVIFSLIN